MFLDGDCVPQARFVGDHAALAEPGCWVQGRRAFVLEKFAAGFRPAAGGVLRDALLLRLTGVGKAFRLPLPVVRRDRSLRGTLGCNLGVWRADLLAVNGFDEAYAGWGREDSDFCARLLHLGLARKLVRGGAIVYHLNHPLQPRGRLADNEARLARVLAERTVRCAAGVEQYLSGGREDAP